MLSRFHLIPERYGQTDRFAISISCISAAIAVMQCLSVCPSVTFVDHVKTNKHRLILYDDDDALKYN